MRTIDTLRLLALSAIWGSSFMFMRVAAPALGAFGLAGWRVTLATFGLAAIAAALRSPVELRARARPYLVLGTGGSTIPFLLFSFASIHLPASMTAILNSLTPLFGAIVAAVWLKERITPVRALGIAVAFAGVGLLVGWSPVPLTPMVALSIGAAAGGALCYAVSAIYTKIALAGAPPIGMALGSQLGAALVLVPLVPLTGSTVAPSGAVLGSVLTLGLVCSALAYLFFYRLLIDIGPTKTMTVTFLAPVFGLLWAGLFLHETITPVKLASCGIILLGTALTSGVLRRSGPAST